MNIFERNGHKFKEVNKAGNQGGMRERSEFVDTETPHKTKKNMQKKQSGRTIEKIT
jgi:hypothetical protein